MKKDEVPSARLIALEQDMAKYKPASSELNANTIEVNTIKVISKIPLLFTKSTKNSIYIVKS